MHSGKNKMNIFTFLTGILAYGVFYAGCRIGYEVYAAFTTRPIHYGVGNAFGLFYSYYILFPVLIFLPLLKNSPQFQKILMVAPLVLLFFYFYPSNPLRTTLLFLCTISGYITVFVCEKINSKFFLR